MKARVVLTAMALFGVVSVGGGSAAQERLWVASDGATLKQETSALSATVAEVPRGTELELLGSDGKWYRVAAPDGRAGWIYRGKVRTEAPDDGGGGLFSSLPGSSIELGAGDTARSIRGLSPEVEAYADTVSTPAEHRRALDTVLEWEVGRAEIEQFLAAGEIGEYAR